MILPRGKPANDREMHRVAAEKGVRPAKVVRMALKHQSMLISPSLIEGHERTLLARFLLENGAVERFPNLRPEHFAVPTHREIFTAIVTLHYDGHSTCFPLVEDYLHRRGKLQSNGEENFVSLIATDNRITSMDDDCFDYALDCVLDAYRQREAARNRQSTHVRRNRRRLCA